MNTCTKFKFSSTEAVSDPKLSTWYNVWRSCPHKANTAGLRLPPITTPSARCAHKVHVRGHHRLSTGGSLEAWRTRLGAEARFASIMRGTSSGSNPWAGSYFADLTRRRRLPADAALGRSSRSSRSSIDAYESSRVESRPRPQQCAVRGDDVEFVVICTGAPHRGMGWYRPGCLRWSHGFREICTERPSHHS
jgi:hypothetical protein